MIDEYCKECKSVIIIGEDGCEEKYVKLCKRHRAVLRAVDYSKEHLLVAWRNALRSRKWTTKAAGIVAKGQEK